MRFSAPRCLPGFESPPASSREPVGQSRLSPSLGRQPGSPEPESWAPAAVAAEQARDFGPAAWVRRLVGACARRAEVAKAQVAPRPPADRFFVDFSCSSRQTALEAVRTAGFTRASRRAPCRILQGCECPRGRLAGIFHYQESIHAFDKEGCDALHRGMGCIDAGALRPGTAARAGTPAANRSADAYH